MRNMTRGQQASKNIIRFSALLAVFAIGLTSANARQVQSAENKLSAKDVQFFETKIRPVLIDKCYSCHSDSANKISGGLRLDSRDGLVLGGDSGAAIEPGNAEESLLMLAISYEDDDYAMPPKKSGGKLPDDVIRDFRNWINQGAADPRVEAAVLDDGGAGEDAKAWWAYQTLQSTQVPTPQHAEWSSQPIDRYVLAKLEENQLHPVADASPLTLLRRVYFDLVGLPPEPTVSQKFQANWNACSTDAERQSIYARVVDSLLASPHFGEHWGRHWMDVVRYAESTGKDLNSQYPYAWRYRDYIIDSLNGDIPYDQFLREQIAGDLLGSSTSEEKARHLIATGFLAIGPKSVNDQNPRQLAVDIADEQIDALSQGFLGITISCARCHDHKFDPISQQDYTAIAGIFLSTETHYGTTGGVNGRNKSSLVDLPKDASLEDVRRKLTTGELNRRKEQLVALKKQREELVRERLAQRRKGELDKSNNDLLRVTNQINVIETILGQYDDEGRPIALAMGVSDKPASVSRLARSTRGRRSGGFVSIDDSPLFIRGEIDRPSDSVKRTIPDWFENVPANNIPPDQSGRKELAEWITHPGNPLTPRVMTNRIWHWLFGAGLVTSVDNFGTTGALPSHPELLDFLAQEFVEQGYSVKSMVRMIVTSRTYRLSAKYDENSFRADPANLYLWRHNEKRLEAESIRDAILFAAGHLDLSRPVGTLIGESGDGVIGRGRLGVSEDAIINARDLHRSIYLPLTRDVEPEMLAIFDGADSAAVQGARQSTNVPGQVLFMLNSAFVAEQAKAVSEQIIGRQPRTGRQLRNPQTQFSTKDFEKQFNALSWLIFSRPATDKETNAAKKLLKQFKDDPYGGWTSIARAMLASSEFRSLE